MNRACRGNHAALLFGLAMAVFTLAPGGGTGPAGITGAIAQSAGLDALIDDLVAANHILYQQGVLDGYGHVSVRHPARPDHFLMAAAVAPGRVARGSVMEFDLDAKPVDAADRRPIYQERFIHSEVYKARPDVNAVVHSHSPTVIPFSVTQVPLRPIMAPASFLSPRAPVFDIRDFAGMTNILIGSPDRGKALAAILADHPVALMRGHGDVVVGPNLRRTVSRAIYTEMNARLQWQATTLGGPITFIAPEEAALMEAARDGAGEGQAFNRTWEMWKEEAQRALERAH
jgi:ribulose-5-phosphate 4-epimerase/fuculose-1-phosphate aldolase